MAKRKISVTVDDELVALAARTGIPLSALVNDALGDHLERLARHAALGDLLARWEEAAGPVDEVDLDEVRVAFAEADGTVDHLASA